MAASDSLPLPAEDLQGTIGYSFSQPMLLLEALTHPSYAAENPYDVPHNQRLEFLGDAVIQIIVTQRLFQQFPDLAEGDLTRMRATLTRQPALARLARHIELGLYLRVGRGESQTNGHERPSNLCDAFEALVAAIYLDCDQRLEPARAFFCGLVDQVFPVLEDLLVNDNPKGALQELAQRERHQKPVYETVSVEGPDHQRQFTVKAIIGDECYGTGQGSKRQKAEEAAAKDALQRLKTEGFSA